jgi:hypothetical protein
MKRLMACVAMLALATAIAGCGAGGSSSSTAAAASVGAATNADATTASGATTAVGATAAATPTSAPAAGGGDTCKFLSASDASALVANPGPVKVAVVDSPISNVTSCTWGTITTDHILLVANELKTSAPVSEIKAAMVSSITESIGGLGDVGGFTTKTSTDVTVAFFKGTTQVTLGVSGTSVNADAVVAAAKKIAGGI